MSVPAEIFKAYDIRGIHGEQLGPDDAEQIGRAFARVIAQLEGKPVGELRLGLGRDMRLSAPEMAARYRAGMVAEGATVVDAGQVGTEMLYYLVGSRGLDGGLMCTASHNPKAYTGAKLVKRGSIALSGDEGIQDIRRMIEDGLGDPASPEPGSVEEVEIYEEFQAAALKTIDPANVKPLKVVVDGDFLTAILAEHLLAKRGSHADILYDARASRAVPDTVRAAGGTPHINRVGHAFFKTRMRDEGAIFGGEVSGHYYFHDFYNADSGTLPALLVLEKLSVEGKKLSALLEPYKAKYFISGEINSKVNDGPAKMAELEEHYGSMDGATVTHVDGVSVDFADWHFNVRPSNTEPLLRLTLESLVSEADMEAKRDEVLGRIRA